MKRLVLLVLLIVVSFSLSMAQSLAGYELGKCYRNLNNGKEMITQEKEKCVLNHISCNYKGMPCTAFVMSLIDGRVYYISIRPLEIPAKYNPRNHPSVHLSKPECYKLTNTLKQEYGLKAELKDRQYEMGKFVKGKFGGTLKLKKLVSFEMIDGVSYFISFNGEDKPERRNFEFRITDLALKKIAKKDYLSHMATIQK